MNILIEFKLILFANLSEYFTLTIKQKTSKQTNKIKIKIRAQL